MQTITINKGAYYLKFFYTRYTKSKSKTYVLVLFYICGYSLILRDARTSITKSVPG